MRHQLRSAVVGTVRAIADTYRLGLRTFVAAPLIVALAIVPEFVQHMAEIQLDMFVSITRFRAFADDPTRWAFGYAKLAGFLLAILLTARFWGRGGSVRGAFAFTLLGFLKLVLGIAAMLAVSELFGLPARYGAPRALSLPLDILSAVVQAGFTVLIVGLLIEDPMLTLRSAFVDRLPTALLMLVTLAAGFGPMQLLHGANHKLAIGQSTGTIWLLMTWDALVVGLMAALTGSAMWVAYRAGPTWRGWGERRLR